MVDEVDESERRTFESAMASAWRQAAAALSIRFLCPFGFRGVSGQEYLCTGWLPDFGGPRGALIVGQFDPAPDDVFEAAAEIGYYASALNPHHYETFDHALFVDTLNDWGWFGPPEEVPAWFRGGIGRHGGSMGTCQE